MCGGFSALSVYELSESIKREYNKNDPIRSEYRDQFTKIKLIILIKQLSLNS